MFKLDQRERNMEEIAVNEQDFASEDIISAADDTASGQDIELYLTFTLGSDLFGIKVSEVREVIEFRQIFRIPRVPEYIRGVINLRGEVVPVIDLFSRFYGRVDERARNASIVIVEMRDENSKTPIGVLIDSVNEVIEISDIDIEAVPEIGSRIRADFIEGIGKPGDRFVILLEIGRVLNIEELSNIEDTIN